MHLLEPEVERDALGDRQGSVAQVGALREQRAHAAGSLSQPSALVRVTLDAAIGTMRRMHSSASATKASAGCR